MDILRKLKEAIRLKSVDQIYTGSALIVPSGVLTTILTLNATDARRIVKISCSGDGYARYKIYLNTVLVDSRVSSPHYAITFKFDYPVDLQNGDILDVKTEHFYSTEQLNFESTVYTIL